VGADLTEDASTLVAARKSKTTDPLVPLPVYDTEPLKSAYSVYGAVDAV
jgi:hypothetical protein